MPADSSRALSTACRPVHDQRRRSSRRSCCLAVTLRTSAGDIAASLRDLSEGGIGFHADALVALRPGLRFTLVHAQLGDVACVLRWAMRPRYGAAFQPGPRALGRIRALYDSLPPAPGDLI